MARAWCTVFFPEVIFLALILSAQSGDWFNPNTWVGHVIPDMFDDDVRIQWGHTVSLYTFLDVYNTLQVDGTLLIDLYGCMFMGGYLQVMGTLDTAGYLEAYGDVDLYGTMIIRKDVVLEGTAWLEGMVTITGGGRIYISDWIPIQLTGWATVLFDRREGGIFNWWDLHRVIDFTKAYGFAAPHL